MHQLTRIPKPLARPPLRRAERDRIALLAASPIESALLIVGEPGSGRSKLLDGIELPGVPVRRARVNAAEAGIPRSGLSAIAASFQDHPVAALSSSLLSTTGDIRGAAELTVEFLTLIRDPDRAPTLLIVDDADEMDPESRAVLAMMAARLNGTGLRLLAAASPEGASGALASMPRLELRPLDNAQSSRLVCEATGHPVDAAVQQMIVASSSGNAGAIAGIARRLSDAQLTRAAPIELPFRTSEASPTAGRPGSAREALITRLSCAYLHGERAISRHDDGGEIEALISDACVVRDGRFLRLRDPLLRARTYWSMTATARRELHDDIALAESEHEPLLALWHRSWSDPELLAVDELLDAAAEFARRGQGWQAVELAERGLSLARSDSQLPPALYRLAAAFLGNGDAPFAERYARLCRRASDPHEAPRLAMLCALIGFVSTGMLAADVAEHAPQLADGSDDATRMLTVLAGLRLLRWETGPARELLARAHVHPDRMSPATLELRRLVEMLLAALEGDARPVVRMLEETFRHERAVPTSPIALIALGRSLMHVDRTLDARWVLRRVIDLEPAPPSVLLEQAQLFLAELEVRSGRHVDAVDVIDRIQPSRSVTNVGQPLYRLLIAWRSTIAGNQGGASADDLDAQRRFAIDDPSLAARIAALRGAAALADGRAADAIEHLEGAVILGAPFSNPSLLRCDVDLVEAYVLAGRLDEAEAHARSFLARSSGHESIWTVQARARVEALLAKGEDSVAAFRRALRLSGDPALEFERARTLLAFGDRLHDLGRGREAAEQYRAARALFMHLGTVLWIRRADVRHLEPHEPSNPLLATLSPEEQQVAQLVVQGLRNKDIAAATFVSLRTVEVRLTRIYQSLGVTSRARLISMLANGDRILGSVEHSG